MRITVGGHTYRTTVAAYGNQFFVPLNRENRTAAGVKAGDTVAVSIEIDDALRIIEVPDDFAKAMKTAKQRTFFDALSFSHQRVRAVDRVRERADTRARRVERAVEMLSEQRDGHRHADSTASTAASSRVPGQSSTTWVAKSARARAQCGSSTRPSARMASAAAQAIASA